MTIEEMVLGLLARHPTSGYDLKKWFDVEGMFIRANADQAQIYRTLRSLKQDGLVDFRRERRGGPEAKVYFPTDAGMERLAAAASTPYEPPLRWQEPDFMARLTLLAPLNPGTAIAQVEREIEFREHQIRQYRNRDRQVDLEGAAAALDVHAFHLIAEWSHQNGVTQLDMWLSWLRLMHAAMTQDPAFSGSRPA